MCKVILLNTWTNINSLFNLGPMVTLRASVCLAPTWPARPNLEEKLFHVSSQRSSEEINSIYSIEV